MSGSRASLARRRSSPPRKTHSVRNRGFGVSRGLTRETHLFIPTPTRVCYNTAHMAQKRLFTGLQPSGALHLGNYFGALKPFVELSREYDSMLMVADYHALTSLRNADEMRTNILGVAKDYVAAGVG